MKTYEHNSNRDRSRRGVTLVEMLVVVALTILLMSIIVEVFVLASETMNQLKSVSVANQKTRVLESQIRLDLQNRTIREVQPPFERKAGPDGILGTDDDWILPVGVDPKSGLGYWMLEENSPSDEQGEDTDDVLAFTVRLKTSARGGLTMFGNAYQGAAVKGSEPDIAYPGPSIDPIGDGIAGSQEAEIVYFLRNGTLYRRVLLVGVPQPTFNPGASSWFQFFDISARPNPIAGLIPIVNSLSDLSYRSTRYIHRTPANYITGVAGSGLSNPPLPPGLATDRPDDANFPFLGVSFQDSQSNPALGAGWHDATTATDPVDHNRNYPANILLSAPEIWYGRPTVRESSDANFDYPKNPDVTTSTAFLSAPTSFGRGAAAQRMAEDAILTNVYSFDVKVWDPDASAYPGGPATGAFVDIGKMWPGASGSVNTPGPTPSQGTVYGPNTASTNIDLPGGGTSLAIGPQPGTWPPLPRRGVAVPEGRGFAEPYGYNSPPPGPPYAILPGTDGLPLGMFRAPVSLCRTYDTWCTAYTKPTRYSAVPVAPPYIVPIRGIQIKIRFADLESRLTREITIVQELQ